MDHTTWLVRFQFRVTAGRYEIAPFPGIIILATQALSLVLRKIRQPKVIAEVIGGIILGE